jgi:hypothetical protein
VARSRYAPSKEALEIDGCSSGRRQMKVVDGLSGGIEPGSTVPVAELGLPVKGTSGLLLVFWKST